MESIKNSSVRVRFAPSPTGTLHIGGLRTALFNYLFARHHGGTFLVRIEDTDKERSKKEYKDAQMASLEWAGIISDEPLVFQSQRMDVYEALLNTLIEQKKVYRCTCTDQEREDRARAAGHTDNFYAYDNFCRNTAVRADCGIPFVLRFAVPKTCTEIKVDDLIRGTVVFQKEQFDDFIIVRSDGSPTYNFVVVVDDNFMNITHIIRGEEHLVNTPKQILLAQVCGFPLPQFAHIPLILSPNGGKLSKRDGSVDVLQYKKDGYLPDALVNYIARLGWAYGDQEIFTRQELIQFFTLKGVGKKSAVFDMKKLDWVNSLYIKKLSSSDCAKWLKKDVCEFLFENTLSWSDETREKIIAIYQERATIGLELCTMIMEFYKGPDQYEADAVEKWLNKEVMNHLALLKVQWGVLEEFEHEVIKTTIKEFCTQHDVKLGVLAQPIRIALTGGTESPGVFDLLAVLGKEESIKRIDRLLASGVVKN
ncbi:glutamate--tRNA ligase [Candidatus Babeliales bacterium]|nr:glutamate--tRNA ligase [Candidatus Babeliales bacterium]